MRLRLQHFARIVVSLAVAVSLTGAAARAHDFWLAPTAPRVALGAPIAVTATVGHAGDPEPYRRNPPHIRRLELLGPTVDGAPSRAPLDGRPGALPTGAAPTANAGLHLAVYESNRSGTQMAPDAFEDYLREEGLEWAIAERAARGESDRDGVESFVRCAKTAVLVGDVVGDPRDRAVGLPLELVAEFSLVAHPLDAEGRPQPLSLVLLAAGAPKADVLVSAHSLADPELVVDARTDVGGRVRFDLPQGGGWYFSAVAIERVPPPSNVDWHSTWANLCVTLPG